MFASSKTDVLSLFFMNGASHNAGSHPALPVEKKRNAHGAWCTFYKKNNFHLEAYLAPPGVLDWMSKCQTFNIPP